MYKIEKGILTENGKKLFALGQSYYPSFHYAKYPVPPDGDRIGEMQKDLAHMAQMGFNHVRFAALGLVKLDESGKLVVDTPFVDAMIREADKQNISVSVRLQGYAVNLREFKDVAMVDQFGEPQDMTTWYDFIQTGFHHEGLLEDNRTLSKDLSRHYQQFSNVVAWQIYNEPHFPGKTFFDYHPTSIAAYRKWLVENGHMTQEEAAGYEPPRHRKEQSLDKWALWRLFGRDSLTMFLNNASDAAKEATGIPTYTCFTDDPITITSAYRGADYFANAKSMDIVGYTCYLHGVGADYYPMSMLGDMAQCAAEAEGKESWCIELDSRTYIPCPVFNRNTYTTLGSGVKGIVYYQWRGDCPVPGVPHPNSCGILNFDGTKTANYDNAATAISFMKDNNDLLINARRRHEGIGLLHSDYANYLCDGRENSDEICTDKHHNSHLLQYSSTYKALREVGYNVTITDADHLESNPLGIRVLFIVDFSSLAPKEQAAVERFIAAGGQVYVVSYSYGNTLGSGFRVYRPERLPYKERVYDLTLIPQDLPYVTGITPVAASLEPSVGVQALESMGKTILVLTNISTQRQSVDASIRLNLEAKQATAFAMDGEKEAILSNGILTVKNITDGAIVVLE